MNYYETEVQESNGDFYVEFPEEMIKKLGWKEDDFLTWKIEGDTIILSKRNEPS